MDLSEFVEDNTKNVVVTSDIPAICKEEPCMLGIDEAGRGPVLGPMVYAVAYCPISKLDALKEKGFADSKTLTEKKREGLLKVIGESNDFIGWAIEIHSPNVISNNMLRRSKYNLNEISQDSAIMLLRKAIELGVNVTEVYVDTVGPPEKYQAKLSALFPDLKIAVEKQADSTFPIVSAASICAKVARDNAMTTWKFTEGDELNGKKCGSGYPSDHVTKKFLTESLDPVYGFPQIVRYSWSPVKNLLKKDAVKVSWEGDEEEEEEDGVKVNQLMLFIKKRKMATEEKKSKSDKYFTKRNLTQVFEFL